MDNPAHPVRELARLMQELHDCYSQLSDRASRIEDDPSLKWAQRALLGCNVEKYRAAEAAFLAEYRRMIDPVPAMLALVDRGLALTYGIAAHLRFGMRGAGRMETSIRSFLFSTRKELLDFQAQEKHRSWSIDFYFQAKNCGNWADGFNLVALAPPVEQRALPPQERNSTAAVHPEPDAIDEDDAALLAFLNQTPSLRRKVSDVLPETGPQDRKAVGKRLRKLADRTPPLVDYPKKGRSGVRILPAGVDALRRVTAPKPQ